MLISRSLGEMAPILDKYEKKAIGNYIFSCLVVYIIKN